MRLQADINVTPMVDVMLVLLVIFMVAAPMMAASLKVELPSAATASQDSRHRPVTVSIASQGGLFIGKAPTSETAFAADMKAALGGDLSRQVLINADRTTQHGRVVRVMDLLAQLGVHNLGIVADARERPQQSRAGE